MYFKLFMTLSAIALILAACGGTFDVSFEQNFNTPITPAGADPTKTTLEMEATSMSSFVTQQAATLVSQLGTATPPASGSSGDWKVYRNPTFGFSFEYPLIYDMGEQGSTCGLRADDTGVHLGQRIELLFLSLDGRSLEAFAANLINSKTDWTVESQEAATVSERPAITVNYRFGGTGRAGTMTLMEYQGLVFAFGFTAGDFCEIPGWSITEPEAYTHLLQSFRLTGYLTQTVPTLSPGVLYPVLVYPPYGSRTGFLLGGWNGSWLDSASTAALLTGQENYAFYGQNMQVGLSMGTMPEQSPPFCPALWELSLYNEDPFSSVVALNPDYTALPRRPQEISTDNAIYRQVVDELLRTKAIDNPDVRLTRVLKVDLEGDGVDEILINASRFLDTSYHDVSPGDYSLVLLRKVSGDSVATIPLVEDYYLEPESSIFPNEYLLTGALDLNGDSKMEIVISLAGWEKLGALAYESKPEGMVQVLQVRCPE